MSYNVMKDLPKIPHSPPHSNTGAEQRAKKSKPNILLDTAAPESIDRLRQVWTIAPSPRDAFVNKNNEPESPLSSCQTASQEGFSYSPALATSTPITPAFRKRWGVSLSLSKHEVRTRRSFKFLKNSTTTKSVPDLASLHKTEKVDIPAVPRVVLTPASESVMALPLPPARSRALTAGGEVGDAKFNMDADDKGIYFACDPNWEPSQGDATFYLVFPTNPREDNIPEFSESERKINRNQEPSSAHSLPR